MPCSKSFCESFTALSELPTMAGMTASLVVMNLIYWPANVAATKEWWLRTFGAEVFWPWFTLIGTLVTLGVAWGVARVWPERAQKVVEN